MVKPCDQHSGIDARLTQVEKNMEEIGNDIKQINTKLNKYTGAILTLAAIPLILKIIELLTPIAKAIN